MTDLKRYYTPTGAGAALHPCGMLYMVSEVDAKLATLTAERDGIWAANLRLIRERDAALARAEAAEAALDGAIEAAAIAVFGAVTQDPQKTSEEVLLHASRIIRSMKGGAA